MRARWVAAYAVLGLVAAAGAYAAGMAQRPEDVRVASAVPVPAVGGPVEPEREYAEDIGYPALQPGLSYQTERIGSGDFGWSYRVPEGWKSYQVPNGNDELRWRPEDEPVVGGFSLRVKVVNDHRTTEQEVAFKLDAMLNSYQDVHIRVRDDDTLGFTYREPTYDMKRFNTFRWITFPDSDEVGFEMSVVGRAVDVEGLDDLLQQVSESVTKLD